MVVAREGGGNEWVEPRGILGRGDHPHDTSGELHHCTSVKTHGMCGTTSDPSANLGLQLIIVFQS